MKSNRELIIFAVGAILGICTGFFTGKAIYDQPLEESIKTDTVVVTDTIRQYFPMPKDSTLVKYVTKYLPVLKTDTIMGATITHWEYISTHDTVAVEVPITSKHYSSAEYDAWVSGFEPSLDSIKVYQETNYITTTVTKVKPPNKLSLNVHAGINYAVKQHELDPYVVGELIFNNHKRVSWDVHGGVISDSRFQKVEPIIGGGARIRLF